MRVRKCGSVSNVLLVTDGLACYAKQALHGARDDALTRPQLQEKQPLLGTFGWRALLRPLRTAHVLR
jgi:hypothetical protein